MMEFIIFSAIWLAAASCFYYKRYRAERKKRLQMRAKLRKQIKSKDDQLYNLRQKLHEPYLVGSPTLVNLTVNKTYIISKNK